MEVNFREIKVEYLIERAKKHVFFGDVKSVVQWEFWYSFDNKKDRDKALKKLSKQNTLWELRARDIERLDIFC